MIPQDVYDKKVRVPKVLVVLSDADFSDPNWSIHVLTHYDSYTQLAAKEGFVIVGLVWVLWSVFGALPFVLSGYIPNMIDAVFETASGFTTTPCGPLS